MPELPEVETTRRGIAPYLEGHYVDRVVVREPRLRWPIPADLHSLLSGQRIQRVERRAKYLLLRVPNGTAILHLGMSGSLRIVSGELLPGRHDHVDLVLADGACLRLTDPRRFGALLWTADDPLQHPLLAPLGPEPLQDGFDGDYLYVRSRGRSLAVKSFLMNSRIVVGVGNIYSNEALFIAGIHPQRKADRISKERYQELALAVRRILEESITQGGTTLRNFLKSDGRPGYFRLRLRVYGRVGQACRRCGDPIRHKRIGQRSSFYCARCQH